jgi:glycosyltransferase involved in cell wall biosynthesis
VTTANQKTADARVASQSEASERSKRPLVVCAADDPDPDWRWFQPVMPEYEWRFVDGAPRSSGGVAKGQSALLSACWDAVRTAEKNRDRAILVTHGSRMGLRCAAIRRLIGAKAPHINYTFHLETKPGNLKAALIRETIPGFDRMVVYTTVERDTLRKRFAIPDDKIEMVYWGAREPEALSHDVEPIESGDYICAIGANARDYPTLMAAMKRRPDKRLVAVVRPRNLEGLDVPDNVTVHTNLPQQDCWNILAHSRFMVLPLAKEAASGHSVLVQTMFLKVPFIVSDTPATADYIVDSDSALVYPSGDVEALVSRIDTLWQDEALCRRLGDSSQAFARANCGEQAVIEHFRRFVQSRGLA